MKSIAPPSLLNALIPKNTCWSGLSESEKILLPLLEGPRIRTKTKLVFFLQTDPLKLYPLTQERQKSV